MESRRGSQLPSASESQRGSREYAVTAPPPGFQLLVPGQSQENVATRLSFNLPVGPLTQDSLNELSRQLASKEEASQAHQLQLGGVPRHTAEKKGQLQRITHEKKASGLNLQTLNMELQSGLPLNTSGPAGSKPLSRGGSFRAPSKGGLDPLGVGGQERMISSRASSRAGGADPRSLSRCSSRGGGMRDGLDAGLQVGHSSSKPTRGQGAHGEMAPHEEAIAEEKRNSKKTRLHCLEGVVWMGKGRR